MNIQENITRILADSYYQAANSNCDMFRITDILEEVRELFVSAKAFMKVEDRLEIHIGENLENDNEFNIVQHLSEDLRELKRNHYESEILQAFRTEKNEGWQKWLQIFGFELTKANQTNLNFLLDLKIPVKQKSDFRKIKKYIPIILKNAGPNVIRYLKFLLPVNLFRIM